jgi:diguanylate cyclase (GGDEF)-like protein
MTALKEDPHRAVILGAGQGGSAILEMLMSEELVSVVAVVDIDQNAPGVAIAREHGIPVYTSIEEALHASAPCVAFNLTGNEMIETVAAEILGAGGIIGGMEARLMLNMITNLKKAKEELRYQASHDPLTGLYNRRHMIEQLQQGISQAMRYRHDYTIVMFDLDHFKQVNDIHGHAAGDLVLSNMAAVLRESVRESDIPGRWGGEEFIVLLPHTNLAGAVKAAEQWLARIRRTPAMLDNGKAISTSFSAGVATLDLDSDCRDAKALMEQLLHEADERMYAAKTQGRNRVCVDCTAAVEHATEQT